MRANSTFVAASELFRPEDFRCEGMALFALAAMATGGVYREAEEIMLQKGAIEGDEESSELGRGTGVDESWPGEGAIESWSGGLADSTSLA